MQKLALVSKLVIKILFSFLLVSAFNFTFSKNTFAAAFNVTVNDPTHTLRWSEDGTPAACNGPKGIVISCVSNCSDSNKQWDCNDSAGGHLNIWNATDNSNISVRLTPPSSPSFPTATWSVIHFGSGATLASGSGWQASFNNNLDTDDWAYGVFFTMYPPPTSTPTPTPTPTLIPSATPTLDLFVGGAPGCETPPGCFDCQWRTIAGMAACRAVNISCSSGYTHDADYCGQLTPLGSDICEAPEHQQVPCVNPSGESCVGVSTDQPGTCYTTTLCPENTVEDGAYPAVCSSGGRCCVSPVTTGPVAYFCGSADEGINTAIGCIIYTSMTPFTRLMLLWFMGIGGGIAFILMVFAAFMIMTSGGDPQRLAGGKALLTSAIVGLLFIVFSVFLLRVTGVDILRIPGF